MSSDPEANKPTLDRSTLLPILLGVFSLFGILIVFMIGRVNADRSAVPVAATDTPFKYQLIGTEPGISTADPLAEGTSLAEEGDSGDPLNGSSGSPGLAVTAQQGVSTGSGASTTEEDSNEDGAPPGIATPTVGTIPVIILKTNTKSSATSLPIINRTQTPTNTQGAIWTPTLTRTRTSGGAVTSTPSRTPTLSTGATQVPLSPGTYDDSHPLIDYNGWNIVTDPTAYQSTLHVSSTAGSTVIFRFTGQQMRITFQSTASFGTVQINLGGLNFDLDQSNGTNEWVSVLLAQGTYTVTITHLSGGSVNIDSVIIPDLNTPTPTVTPTATSNGQ